jgi:hypothetical protein
MMINLIKTKIEEAVRAKDTTASNIFKLVLSECQRANKEDDDFIVKFMGKIVEGNNETLKYRADEKLVRENNLLRPYLPILIDRAGVMLNASKIPDSIKAAKSDGQAIGVLSKHLKQLGLDFNIEDVKHAIFTIREYIRNA